MQIKEDSNLLLVLRLAYDRFGRLRDYVIAKFSLNADGSLRAWNTHNYLPSIDLTDEREFAYYNDTIVLEYEPAVVDGNNNVINGDAWYLLCTKVDTRQPDTIVTLVNWCCQTRKMPLKNVIEDINNGVLKVPNFAYVHGDGRNRVAIEDFYADKQKFYCYSVMDKRFGDLYDAVSDAISDLAFVNLINFSKPLPLIDKLPDSPAFLVPQYAPEVHLSNIAYSKCKTIKFADEFYSDIYLSLLYTLDALILPKHCIGNINIDLYKTPFERVQLPESCKQLTMKIFSDEENILDIPLVHDANVNCRLTTVAKELIVHPDGNYYTLMGRGSTEDGTVKKLRIDARHKTTFSIDLNFNFTEASTSYFANCFEIDTDTLDMLHIKFPLSRFPCYDITIRYSSLNKVKLQPSGTDSYSRVKFVCKSGGTPISASNVQVGTGYIPTNNIDVDFE